jgi:hypothetical protein
MLSTPPTLTVSPEGVRIVLPTTVLATASMGGEVILWLGILTTFFALEGLLRALMATKKGQPQAK